MRVRRSVAGDAVENLIGSPGPHEGFGGFVMDADELANRRLQFFDAPEGAPSKRLVGKFGEPSFGEVQPRAIGWGEVNVESRAA